MPKATDDLPPPVNHVFVDYENVHHVDPAIIGSRTVHLTLLLGAKKAKLEAAVVEKLLDHAANVEFIRLKSSGKNAVDFALAYYLGCAVLADPGGCFHIVAKDGGYDPLIEHLRSKHIHVRRHEDFTSLTFSGAAKPPAAPAPVISPASKPPAKPKTPPTPMEALEARVLEHLRKPTTNRPRTRNKLVSHLITHLGKKATEAEVMELVEMICQAGHFVSDDKGKVTYHLVPA